MLGFDTPLEHVLKKLNQDKWKHAALINKNRKNIFYNVDESH